MNQTVVKYATLCRHLVFSGKIAVVRTKNYNGVIQLVCFFQSIQESVDQQINMQNVCMISRDNILQVTNLIVWPSHDFTEDSVTHWLLIAWRWSRRRQIDILRSSLIKEMLLALLNGIALAAVLLVFTWLWKGHFLTALAISLSLIAVILVAGFIGTFIPLFLHKRNIDPAIATGPFITTSNDIFGILIYFWIAKVVLGI